MAEPEGLDTNHTRGQDVKATSAPENDWQRIWISTRQTNWSSLAIIPSDASVEVGGVAETLAETGRLYGERPVSLLNAKGTQLENIRQLLDTLNTMTGHGDWVIVEVDPIAENPSSVPIIQATSAALLVVRLGESLLSSARSAIEVIGRAQFLGSIVLHGQGPRRRPSLHLAVPALTLILTRLLTTHP
jgi:hypothetical protein